MLERVLRFSIRQRWLVVLVTIAIGILGLVNFARLPIDAVPDITTVQVQINTSVEGLSPIEIEQRITFPIESAMAGVPGLGWPEGGYAVRDRFDTGERRAAGREGP